MKVKLNWDGVGIATSLICAIHCALLPILLSSATLFGINIIHNEVFEWLMILIAIAVGYYSLIHGYSRHHRSHTPIIMFSVGAVFLVFKQFLPEHSSVFLSIAVILIIGWILGITAYSAGGLIHILLVLAIVSLLLGLIRRGNV